MTTAELLSQRIPLTPAPAHETLVQVRDRLVHHMLVLLSPKHETIAALATLYAARIEGREPEAAAWQTARDRLDSARSTNYRALAIALALDRALAIALALALDLARALDLDLALQDLLGDRLVGLTTLDADILRAVEVEKRFRLFMGTWHGGASCGGIGDSACGTTHCRAGSAIALHPMGAELEAVFGSQLAGAVIYLAARKGTPLEGQVPDFLASDEAAWEDIKRCAAAQKTA
jgi:hypothetical protein